ncbi:MAG: pentapeptide repeat-containing protein [Phenylobacterium sp.]|nr:pentapeptide repeat-containing protein [Phenylobacterium sp.]
MTRNETLASLAVNAWINRGRVVWPWADLRGCDLSGADLSGAYLHGAKIDFGGRTFTLKEADQ